jgi:hypothetical protein
MRSTAFLIALLVSGAAAAQMVPPADPADPSMTLQPAPPPGPVPPPEVTPAPLGMTAQTDAAAPADQVVQPGNSAPERDARGIPVISAPAIAPAGFNQAPGTFTGMGGPQIEAATSLTPEPAAEAYPACSRTVTDHCVQTYERGRAPQ